MHKSKSGLHKQGSHDVAEEHYATVVEWLQQWYSDQTDGEWEHAYGIVIDNIDNPGWSIKIDLIDTPLSSKQFPRLEIDNGDTDWYFCWVEANVTSFRFSDIFWLIRVDLSW
jgi:hypothetical protein